MKRIPTIIISASILLPGFVSAAQDPFDRYVEEMIEQAEAGGGTVIIENHSSVSTGSQVSSEGGSVTDGDVSASSHVETYINAGEDGGTVQVKTETSENGETETQEYTKEIEPGEPVEVNVSAKATNEGSETETKIQSEVMEEATADAEEAEAEIGFVTRVEEAIMAVPSFFKKVLDFVTFW